MPPIKIRAFGLFAVTRRAYLIVQTGCFTALALGLAWLWFAPPNVAKYYNLAAAAKPAEQGPIRAFAFLLEHGAAVLLIALALGAAETWWMLRRFKAAEAKAASRVGESQGGHSNNS